MKLAAQIQKQILEIKKKQTAVQMAVDKNGRDKPHPLSGFITELLRSSNDLLVFEHNHTTLVTTNQDGTGNEQHIKETVAMLDSNKKLLRQVAFCMR